MKLIHWILLGSLGILLNASSCSNTSSLSPASDNSQPVTCDSACEGTCVEGNCYR